MHACVDVCICVRVEVARVSIPNLVLHFSPKLQDKIWNGNLGLRKVVKMKGSVSSSLTCLV